VGHPRSHVAWASCHCGDVSPECREFELRRGYGGRYGRERVSPAGARGDWALSVSVGLSLAGQTNLDAPCGRRFSLRAEAGNRTVVVGSSIRLPASGSFHNTARTRARDAFTCFHRFCELPATTALMAAPASLVNAFPPEEIIQAGADMTTLGLTIRLISLTALAAPTLASLGWCRDDSLSIRYRNQVRNVRRKKRTQFDCPADCSALPITSPRSATAACRGPAPCTCMRLRPITATLGHREAISQSLISCTCSGAGPRHAAVPTDGQGLWEVRCNLPGNRIGARFFLRTLRDPWWRTRNA